MEGFVFKTWDRPNVCRSYLEQLYGSAVLLLPAQLSNLDEDRSRVTWVLRLKTGWQFPALVGLLTKKKSDITVPSSSESQQVFFCYTRTWFVYMASRALLKSMACSCFFASLYSTPSAFVSFTFFFESNTFWSWREQTEHLAQSKVTLLIKSLTVCKLLPSAHLVYCDDIVGSHSEQPHVWWPGNK